MFKTCFMPSTVALFLCLLLAGCGGSSFPDSPEGTLRTISDAMAANEPVVLWDAMPESYRKDVEGLVERFCAKMDADIYDRGAALLNRILEVMKSKRDFILDHPMLHNPLFAQMIPEKEKLKSNWADVIDLVAIVTRSELSSLDALSNLDIRDFIDSTGSELMERLSALSKLSDGDAFNRGFREALAGATYETLSVDGDRARIRITSPGEGPKESIFVKVEGRWIPEEMAEEWKKGIAEIEESLDSWTGDELAAKKEEILSRMAAAEKLFDKLAVAKSAKEFNQVVMEFLQGL